MNANDILYLYRVNERILQLNCDDISEEESHITTNGSSSLNWIVGHALRCRSDILESVDRDRIHAQDELIYYRPTNEAAVREGEPWTLSSLLAEITATQPAFLEAVEAAWKKANETSDATARKNLLFYSFHEAYHVGQLGLFRRIIGKPGKIA